MTSQSPEEGSTVKEEKAVVKDGLSGRELWDEVRISPVEIAMPGGVGTFEELFEVLTWAQLGIHHKPCGCLNIAGYFDPLSALLDHAVSEGFVRPQHRRLLISSNEPAELLMLLTQHQPPAEEKWLGREVI